MNAVAYGLAAHQIASIAAGTFYVARAKHHARVKVLSVEGTQVRYRKANGEELCTEGCCFTMSFRRAKRQ